MSVSIDSEIPQVRSKGFGLKKNIYNNNSKKVNRTVTNTRKKGTEIYDPDKSQIFHNVSDANIEE